MAAIVYGLCALASLLCTWLLLRAYCEQRIAILFWCGLFFAAQTFSNALLIVDKLMVPNTDLSVYRYGFTLTAVSILLYGLIMRTEAE